MYKANELCCDAISAVKGTATRVYTSWQQHRERRGEKLVMSESKYSVFSCCRCCPSCCNRAPNEEKEALTIHTYQPVVPIKKEFGYPQHGLEQPSSSSRTIQLVPVVTSQPTATSGPAQSHAPRSLHAPGVPTREAGFSLAMNLGETTSGGRSDRVPSPRAGIATPGTMSPVSSHSAATPAYSRSTTPAYSRSTTPAYSHSSTPAYSRSPTPGFSRSPTPGHSRSSTPGYSRSPTPTPAISPPPPSASASTSTLVPPSGEPGPQSGSAFIQHDSSLELNLYYDSHRESLCVQIHRGLYFPQKHGFKSIDSFVSAFLVPSKMQTLKTRLISNSRSPAFDQVLEFSGLSLMEYKEQTLVLQVFYRNRDGSDSCIATCCTKLLDFNLMESNQLTISIDAGKKDLLELTKSEQISLNEELQELFMSGMEPERCNSELLFTIYYNSSFQKLSIHLERILNLPTKLPEESSNPFVQIYLLSKTKHKDVYTSEIAVQTHQPSFDSMATFDNVRTHDLDTKEVVFRIYLNGELHFLGGVVHPLSPTNLYGSTVTAEILPFPEEDSLKDTLQADLLMSLCYQPEAKKIGVTMLEVKIRKHYTGHESSNHYIRVRLRHEGESVAKWKTSTKKGSTNPVYKESKDFELDQLEPGQAELTVKVMNSDHFGRRHELGRVQLGEGVSGYKTGQSQWNKAIANPDTTVTAWHPVFPSPSSHHKGLLPTSSRSRSRSPVYKLKQTIMGLQV